MIGTMYFAPVIVLMVLYAVVSGRMEPSPGTTERKLASAETIVSLLCTIAGIGGLVLFILAGQRLDLYILCGAAAIALIVLRPRRSRWEETIKELSGS